MAHIYNIRRLELFQHSSFKEIHYYDDTSSTLFPQKNTLQRTKRKPQPQSGIENPSRSRRSLAVVARMKKPNDHAERQKSNAKKNIKNKNGVSIIIVIQGVCGVFLSLLKGCDSSFAVNIFFSKF